MIATVPSNISKWDSAWKAFISIDSAAKCEMDRDFNQ